ncbi:DUF3109 family protein [Brevibacillus sp. SYSU BS000544]|uniref:DUF3109 family protein n=1 Tax=Brevibacillus sp. SYSU BS000544 TaxID=3416443 RepID=UPI003CE5BC2E
MNTSMKYAYYGTSDPMAEREIYRLEKYLKQHKKELLYTERFIIDIKALQRPFMLDCFNCKKVHQVTCCEEGQPYAVHYTQVKPMEEYAFAMKPGFMSPEAEESMREKGIWQLGRYDTIRTYRKSCIFVTELNGVSCCSIHAHAAAHGHDVFPIKPFSCMLYPIELIQLPTRILITALTEETASFNRWGNDYLDQFYCASLERRQANDELSPELFPVERYESAYVWGKDLLERTFGHELIELIEQHIK